MSVAYNAPLPWQEDLWRELTAQVLQQRLSHAVLLTGPDGAGKRWFARALAAFLLCEQRGVHACGQCRSCVQLAVGAHPNALHLGNDGLLGMALNANGQHEQGLIHWEPEEKSQRRDISIKAARTLIERLSLSSHYGGSRVAIVDPADALNVNSVNALLKTIEEPPPATYLLLVAARPQALAATLRSRCQRVRMPLPSTDVAAEWLSAQGQPGDSREALAAAYGAPLHALELMQGDDLSLRRTWIELWTGVGRRRTDPVTAAARIDRDHLAAHLRWAWGWLYEHLRSRALRADAEPAALEALEAMLDEVIEALRLVGGNAQPQLLLESLFVNWLRLGPNVLGKS
jgi:DNA polymerase-3 subunit delta'